MENLSCIEKQELIEFQNDWLINLILWIIVIVEKGLKLSSYEIRYDTNAGILNKNYAGGAIEDIYGEKDNSNKNIVLVCCFRISQRPDIVLWAPGCMTPIWSKIAM